MAGHLLGCCASCLPHLDQKICRNGNPGVHARRHYPVHDPARQRIGPLVYGLVRDPQCARSIGNTSVEEVQGGFFSHAELNHGSTQKVNQGS